MWFSRISKICHDAGSICCMRFISPVAWYPLLHACCIRCISAQNGRFPLRILIKSGSNERLMGQTFICVASLACRSIIRMNALPRCSQRRTTPPCWSTWFYNLLIRKSNASHWGSVCSKQSRSKCKRIGSCRKECASVIWCRISFLYDRIKSMPTNTRLSGMSGLSLCSPYTNQKWKTVEIARAIWTKIATDNGPRSARLGMWCTANIWGRAHKYCEPSNYSQSERDSAINAN